jgi:hypothetical protein
LDQIKLAVTLNLEEELYLMDGDMANGWGREKSFAQVLKFFMHERRGGTLQGWPMLMRMRLSSSMLGDTYPLPGCIFAQGKPPKRMGIVTLTFAMAQREITKVLNGPNAPPRKDMCYVQARDEFDFHAIDIQEDFFKLEWEATHGQSIVKYILEIRNRIVLAPIKHGKVDEEQEEYIRPRIFPMIDILLERDNIDTSRMRVSPIVTTKELQDMYQHLPEMIWARRPAERHAPYQAPRRSQISVSQQRWSLHPACQTCIL